MRLPTVHAQLLRATLRNVVCVSACHLYSATAVRFSCCCLNCTAARSILQYPAAELRTTLWEGIEDCVASCALVLLVPS
jgi:hypothetical protein